MSSFQTVHRLVPLVRRWQADDRGVFFGLRRVRFHFAATSSYAHEFILVPEFGESGATELDLARRLIDFGIHPPTMSWPIHHCLMIEPTETESLSTLDHFVEVMLRIADEVESDAGRVKNAPHTTPVRRLDKVTASREPNVRWRPTS